MYETYQDHPKQAKGNIRVVLAVVFSPVPSARASFLSPVWSANRCPRKKPAPKLESFMILPPLRAVGITFRRRKSKRG